jgi:pimeloyl-ACP methyl ester carboxylesterase
MAYFTASDGCKLYCEEYGTGEPLLFIHGWSCHLGFFAKQFAYFSKKYHVIAYDLRGHGRSDRGEITERNMTLTRFAEDLYELIEGLRLDKVNLVGWSMGTSTLLAYVRKYGCKYVNKLCMIDMTPKLLTDDDDEWRLGSFGAFTHKDNLDFLSLLAKDWDAAAAQFIPTCFAKGFSAESELFKQTLAEAKKNTPHVMISMWIAMASEDFRPVLSDITAPTLLAYGLDGALHSKAHGEYMAEHIKNSKLVLFPGCGHALIAEDADKFNAELDAFLTE